MNELIARIFRNPKTTITGVGLVSAIVTAEAGAFPHVRAIAALAVGVSAAYNFLAKD